MGRTRSCGMRLRAQVALDQLVAIRIGVRLREARTTRLIGGALVLGPAGTGTVGPVAGRGTYPILTTWERAACWTRPCSVDGRR
jgi:hypothetical protein